VLAVTIEGVRRNLAHPVETVWVVIVPESKSARVAAERGCRIVDEGGVLPIGPDDIDYHFGSLVRPRWLFQQLLKLSADTISSRVHVLMIDADTVLVRPHVYESGERLCSSTPSNTTNRTSTRTAPRLDWRLRLACRA
jgi:hypothetical protein